MTGIHTLLVCLNLHNVRFLSDVHSMTVTTTYICSHLLHSWSGSYSVFSLLDLSKCTRVTYYAALYAILTYVWYGHKPVPWRKNMNTIMAICYVVGTIQTFAHRSYNTYRGWVPFRLEIVWCWFVVVLVSTSMSSFVHSFQIAYRFLDPVILRVLRVITIHRNVDSDTRLVIVNSRYNYKIRSITLSSVCDSIPRPLLQTNVWLLVWETT